MKSLLLLFCFFTGYFESLPPETSVIKKLTYVITQKGKPIGNIKATRLITGDDVQYEVETIMNVKVLLTQRIKYQCSARYKDGVMQGSLSKSFVNDKLHQTCTVTQKDGKYHVAIDKETVIINNEITYSGAMLYFDEPKNITGIFSEMTGQLNGIKKAGETAFILTDAKSRKQNFYWYKGGILDHAYLNHTLVDIEIKRTN